MIKELEVVKLELETLKACYNVDILLYENRRMQEDVAREIKGCKELIDDIESLGIFKSGEEHAGIQNGSLNR